MSKKELILNISIGLSVISWGVIGGFKYINDEQSNVRLITSLFNCVLGILFLFRIPISQNGSLYSLFISIPSFILGGILFKQAQPFHQWSSFYELIFAVGALFAMISFIILGKNFAIFPALREISTGGVYGLIRHPGYLGETAMVAVCFLANLNIWSLVLFLFFIISLLFRIDEEEKILSQTAEYRNYKRNVKWKLIPFVI